jgi:hypothetical protein
MFTTEEISIIAGLGILYLAWEMGSGEVPKDIQKERHIRELKGGALGGLPVTQNKEQVLWLRGVKAPTSQRMSLGPAGYEALLDELLENSKNRAIKPFNPTTLEPVETPHLRARLAGPVIMARAQFEGLTTHVRAPSIDYE